jgi:hypothetical protein
MTQRWTAATAGSMATSAETATSSRITPPPHAGRRPTSGGAG